MILDESTQEEITGGEIWGTRLVETCSTASSSVDGRPVDFRLQMQPVSWNCKYHYRTDLPLGGSVPEFIRKCHWTLTTDLFTWKSKTENDLCSPLVAIFLSCLLVGDSGTNAEKINFESLPPKAHISQQDTLIRFRIINYWNREHLSNLPCIFPYINLYRSQCPRGLKHDLSSLARSLGSWVRIPLNAWMTVCVYSVFMLSCVGSDLATGWSPVQGILSSI
jgi:hypothetical protein